MKLSAFHIESITYGCLSQTSISVGSARHIRWQDARFRDLVLLIDESSEFG